MSGADPEKLYDFLNAVPHQLTIDLVRLSPYIHAMRNLAEILSWNSKPVYNSWLALTAWWTVCLFYEEVVRYGFPLALAFLFFRPGWSGQQPSTPVTEDQFQVIIGDLSILSRLTPVLPSRLGSLTSSVVFRAAGCLLVAYLTLTFLVSLRTVIALIGTVIISWRAPWAIYTRRTVWSSAYFRSGCYRMWSRISGEPITPAVFTPPSSAPQPVSTVRFLFTIYENQRWWMGLDWTAALLPAERPSWCSSRQDPISPPNAFALPDPSTTYLTDSQGQRIKRTATWRWEEAEWKVIVRKEDTLLRVEKPLPEDPNTASKIAAKTREASQSVSLEASESSTEEPPDWQEEEDIVTDSDGWIYGDNKWEGKNNKGGIGKFTRYRRWTRIAVVEEATEIVQAGPTGIEPAVPPMPESSISDNSHASDNPLRQRLRTAFVKGT